MENAGRRRSAKKCGLDAPAWRRYTRGMEPARVFVYGEIALDHILHGDGAAPQELHAVGGLASNVAVLLANWGMPTALSGYRLGTDSYGRELLEALLRLPALDLSALEVDPGATTAFCRIRVEPDGERRMVGCWSDTRDADFSPLTPGLLDGASHFVIDMLGLRPDRLPAVKRARDMGLTIVAGDVSRLDLPALPLLDVICNSAQMLARAEVADALSFARRLHEMAGAVVVTTDGPRPVHVIDRSGSEFWALPVDGAQVVDTTGAGDALKAGLVFGLASGWPMEESLRFGVGASSLTIEALGAVARMPSLEETRARAARVELRKQAQDL